MSVDETPQQRETKAIQLAEARGRRQQEVDGRLDEHDRRFARINGSIDRSARAQEATESRLAALERKVDQVIAKMKTADEVSGALAKAAVSRREFWLGVAAVVAVLVASLLQGAHL
jgi:sugar-specific transcriptional regulator TrmB